MDDQPGEAAAARIDRALARIEAAARSGAVRHAAIVERHAALRAEVADAVAALDSLIADAAMEDRDDPSGDAA